MPFIASWPGAIPPGSTSNETVMTMDFFPTFAKLAGVATLKIVRSTAWISCLSLKGDTRSCTTVPFTGSLPTHGPFARGHGS